MDNNLILPARAGVILTINVTMYFVGYFTRTSGGDPGTALVGFKGIQFYPHERG